jgi:DeoR/GlpR family transcriptional regulator of sugar metabolism
VNQERRNQIAEMIREKQVVKNAELMERFGISIETVRRDLQYLEEHGVLERVYGGAVRKTFINMEPTYADREQTSGPEKQLIAAEAQKLLHPRDTVFFDLGTTVKLVAQLLERGKPITAFTNALRTALVLVENEECEVIVTGGRLRAKELSVAGPLSEENMRRFNVDKALIGVAGITEDGITDFIIDEASLRSQVIKNARQVIALADHSKFGIRAVSNICGLSDIDVLITDEKAPQELLDKIRDRGVKVIVAKTE